MYGCFSKESPWVNNKSRPITEFPLHPSTVTPTFCLKTRYNSKECQYLDYTNRSSIFRSYYTPFHKTYVLAHGFLDNGEKPWMLVRYDLTSKVILKYWKFFLLHGITPLITLCFKSHFALTLKFFYIRAIVLQEI